MCKRTSLYHGCLCLLCENGRMYRKEIQDEFEYKGFKFSEPAVVYWCDNCNDGFYAEESEKIIEEKVKAFFEMVKEKTKENE